MIQDTAITFNAIIVAFIAREPSIACTICQDCGDYDPVGLDECLSVKIVIGERVNLHIPPNLKDLVLKYGRPELLADSTAVLNRLRGTSDPAIRQVVSILDDAGCGLEQEALLKTDNFAALLQDHGHVSKCIHAA